MILGRRKPLTLAQQFINLRGNPISFGDGELRASSLTWHFPATPTPLSRSYDVRVEYLQGEAPDAFIDAPDLRALSAGRRIPHLYQQKPTRLCLYLPRTFQWQPWMRIDQTIVPWTVLWLYYFEEWLDSDEWKGGGEHPEPEYEDAA